MHIVVSTKNIPHGLIIKNLLSVTYSLYLSVSMNDKCNVVFCATTQLCNELI